MAHDILLYFEGMLRRSCNFPFTYPPLQIAVGLHIMSIVVNSQNREVIPCDAQVWILKITDAIGKFGHTPLSFHPCLTADI
jgi:hypothetical protein